MLMCLHRSKLIYKTTTVPFSSGPVASPATMLPSPSPQSQIVPSPVSRSSVGVASPGSALNTPGSVAQSPGSGRTGTEEQAYLDKWKQLQKYREPLKRMINRIEKDEGNGT